MTDFSFSNKAYDLIQQLLDEKSDKPNLIKSVNDLKLVIDITKDVNPLFSEADSKTITSLVKDTFNIDITEEKIVEADHILDEIYRPIKITEIEPEVVCRIEGTSYKLAGTEFQEIIPFYYKHTFPIKEWYGISKKMDLINYNKEFEFIWEKARRGKVFVKNTYKYKLEDNVFSINYPEGRGTVIKRKMVIDNSIVSYYSPNHPTFSYHHKNEYLVRWANTEQRWENENNLKILEDTNTFYDMINSNKTKFKKCYVIVQRQLLTKNEDDTISYSNPIEERVLIIPPCNNIKSYVRKLYPVPFTSVKIIRIEPWFSNKVKEPVRRRAIKIVEPIIRTSGKLGELKKQEREIPLDFVYVSHTPTNVVCKVTANKAKELIDRESGNYVECSKIQYQEFLNKRKENKDERLKPGLTKTGVDPITKQEATRRNRRAYKQKPHKLERGVKEQLVPVIIPEKKETIIQTTPIFKYIKSGIGIFKKVFYGEVKEKIKLVQPAKVILKRILVYIKPTIVKITEEIKHHRRERSNLDKMRFWLKNDLKPLSELKETFKDVERRNNDHYSFNEKWSEIFDRLYILITEARLIYPEYNVNSQLKKKDVYTWVRKIIKDEAHLKWNEDKIDDFIRYIRLTCRGIFNGEKKYSPRITGKRPIIVHKDGTTHGGKPYKKKCKVKLPKKPVDFEVVKSITKIDYSKLKYNLPDPNKPIVIKFNDESGEMERTVIFKDNGMWENDVFICTVKDVTGWHYPDKNVFEDIITDTGGGITQVPIKYRRSKLPFKNI